MLTLLLLVCSTAHAQEDLDARFVEAFQIFEAAELGNARGDDVGDAFLEAAQMFSEVGHAEGVDADKKVQALFNAGLAYEMGGDWNEAIRHYTEVAPETGEEGLQAALRIAQLETRRLRLSEAGAAFEALLERDPQNRLAEDWATEAAILTRWDEDWALASTRFEAVLTRFPETPNAPQLLFESLAAADRAGDVERTTTLLKTFRKRYGKNPEQAELLEQTYVLEAEAARRAGDEARALEIFTRIVKRNKGGEAQARARFELVEAKAQTFAMPLTAASEKAYRKAFERAMKDVAALSADFKTIVKDYPSSDWATPSAVRVGELYHGFANALRAVQCPEPMDAAYCESFKEQLSVAADGLDTDFAKPALETVVAITESGVTTPWIERARMALFEIDPVAYPAVPGAYAPLLPRARAAEGVAP